MTPKEKAEQLVNMFREFADGTDIETDRYSPKIEKEKSKQCALMAVDEVIKSLPPFEYGLEFVAKIEFWNNVKQEIEAL